MILYGSATVMYLLMSQDNQLTCVVLCGESEMSTKVYLTPESIFIFPCSQHIKIIKVHKDFNSFYTSKVVYIIFKGKIFRKGYDISSLVTYN